MNTMKKRQYVKPEINVVECRCSNSLLTGSNTKMYIGEEEWDGEYGGEGSGQVAY